MTEYVKKKKKPTGVPSLGKVGRALKFGEEPSDKKIRAEKTYAAYKENLETGFDKMKRTQKLPFKNTKEGMGKYIDDVYAASKRETAARMSKGGRAKLRGGGMSQRGLGKAFKKGGRA